jgi:FtsH-binding integral membrane protein
MGLGPMCWFGALLTGYTLQPVACVYAPWLLPVVAACFIVPLVLSLLAATRALFRMRNPTDRDRFIGLLGVMTPLIFLIALLWSEFAAIVFSACL